jgi:GNAT superfamily N-acetyltransferase
MLHRMAADMTIRAVRADELDTVLEIINEAAQVYRGAIPDDCWHEPYMPHADLQRDIASGVEFIGYESAGELVGVMGIQRVREVDLIRHAYVRPSAQGRGIGAALIAQLMAGRTRPVLIGTWAAASWAIRFYERHGFQVVSRVRTAELLREYWSIPERQTEVSVVLAQV